MRVSMSATGSVNLIVCFSSAARLLRPFLPGTEEPATTYFQPGLGYPALALFARMGDLLPGRLRNPGNFSPQSQPAETQAANPELAQISARTSAELAAVVLARGELGLSGVLDSFCCSGQCTFSS